MRRTGLAIAAALLACAAPAQAEDADAERYLEALERQREALAPPGYSRSRGLVLSPSPEAEAEAPEPAARVRPAGDGYVEMPEDARINITIEFDFDSAVVRPDQIDRLRSMCTAIERSEIAEFLVYGHTDGTGSEDYNLRLSRLRAEEVRRVMVARCGIAPERLRAVGVGERHPLDPTDPNAPENRRVEFQVTG